MNLLPSSMQLSNKVSPNIKILKFSSLTPFTSNSGLIYLDEKERREGRNLFNKDTEKYQFAPGLGYQPKVRDAGGSIVVKCLKTAEEAIDVIVIQGEGSPGPYDDPDKLEKDHYDVFVDLKEGDTTWETYPVLENPVTSDYWRLDERIYHVGLLSYIYFSGDFTNDIVSGFTHI